MEEKAIVDLFWNRDERAIRETDDRYGDLLMTVAQSILEDRFESEETVNEAYWKVWSRIPPHRPDSLRAYLCKITRQLAIDRYRRRTAGKRGSARYSLSLEELGECLSAGDSTQEQVDVRLLGEAISRFLAGCTPAQRTAFVCRYFFLDSLGDIAARQDTTVAQVKSMLHRTRQSLRDYLQKEGYDL